MIQHRIMIRNWEEFAFGPQDPPNHLHVTIGPKGEIMIGAKAMREFGPYDWAVLLWDRWNGLIGIVPVKEQTQNAFPIVKKIKGEHRVIRAGRFCRFHKILPPRTTACKADIEEDGKLVLDLKATRVVRK